MTKIDDDGGSAFPCKESYWEPSTNRKEKIENPGMSLRDWFAGQALMSMLGETSKVSEATFAQASGLSYRFADAMLAARKKGPSDE